MQLRHLIVGTDFSSSADSALECAITLAHLGLARVTLVHVCELSTELGIPEAIASTAFDEQLLQECSNRLAAVVARQSRCGVEVKGLLRTGKPWEKLENAATEVGASIIVIGRSGAGGAAGIGTVAKHVLRNARRAVLTVAHGDIVMTRAEVAV